MYVAITTYVVSSLVNIQNEPSYVRLDHQALKYVDYSSASWKRMFFTQPALREMEMQSMVRYRNGKPSRCTRKVDEVKGVRMGQLSNIDWPDYGPNEKSDTISVYCTPHTPHTPRILWAVDFGYQPMRWFV